MDELDRKLYQDLKLKIEIPDKCETIIKEGLNKKIKFHSLTKICITSCAGLVLTMGIVYAGTKVYDKIWKEPEKVVGFNIENTNQNAIIQEKDIMSKEEAMEKANELLKKVGCENETIELIEMKNNFANYEVAWNIITDQETKIYLNANNPDSFNIRVDNRLNKDIENYRTTEKAAENTARDLCKKFGYNLDEYTHMKIYSNMKEESDAYIWYVNFYKKYNEIINPYENIRISFIPEINEVYYFNVSDRKCENNPIEIAKESAKEIALKEEKKINTKYEINNIDIELSIVSMNGEAYLRTNDYEQLNQQTTVDYPSEKWVSYRTDSRIRMAWVVTINYKIPDTVNKFDVSYNVNDEQFSYYIDATTGEVIGGCGNYEKMVKKLYK